MWLLLILAHEVLRAHSENNVVRDRTFGIDLTTAMSQERMDELGHIGIDHAIEFTDELVPSRTTTTTGAVGVGIIEEFGQVGALRLRASGFGDYLAAQDGDGAGWENESWYLWTHEEQPLPDGWSEMTHAERDAWMDLHQGVEVAIREVHPNEGPPRKIMLRPRSYWDYWANHPTHYDHNGHPIPIGSKVRIHVLPAARHASGTTPDGREFDGIQPVVWEIDEWIGRGPEPGDVRVTWQERDRDYGLPVVKPGGLRYRVNTRFERRSIAVLEVRDE